MPIYKGVSRLITFDMITTAGLADTTTTPTVTVSKDGGSFVASTNTAARIQTTNVFSLSLTTAEMTADVITVQAVGAGCVPRTVSVFTEADYTSTRAVKIDNLDASILSRSTFAGGAVASVTGSVGSVAGNVSGSTASVVGAVGSVTGNVGGSVASVTGAVGSVTGAVASVTAAVNTNANATETSIAALVANANQQTNNMAALTTQGYTTTRAGFLDVLNGLVAAVWAFTTRTLSAFGFPVTASSVTDKTGYSLTQAFPANFASMAISVGGAVTAGTVSDKTGYALTQAFPANFASMAITAGGAVTAGTVGDKTGYSGTATNFVAAPTAAQNAAVILATPANLLATNASGQVAASNLPTDYQQRGQAVVLPALPNVTVGGYAAGVDPGTLTWGATARTLTAFSFTPAASNPGLTSAQQTELDNILAGITSLIASAGGALTNTQATQLAAIATALNGFGTPGTATGIARTQDVRFNVLKSDL